MSGFFILCLIAFTVVTPSQAVITNGLVTAKLYLPDTAIGYYRGSRFDWSGVISSLEYDKHNFIEQWFDKYDPEIHDAILGPVEAFDPLSYHQTSVGGTFIKVGVGSVMKPDSLPYNFGKKYKIINHGRWKTTAQKNKITFVHSLTDSSGYAYKYIKVVSLTKGKPELALNHVLKNTGTKTIETSVYDHNFFVIDKQKTGPGITINLPFNIKSTTLETSDIVKINGGIISYTNPFQKNKQVRGVITGFGLQPTDYNIRIESKRTGAGVAIISDRPISEMVFWAKYTTSCPEPYIKVKVLPGEEFSWKIIYRLYTFPPTEQ